MLACVQEGPHSVAPLRRLSCLSTFATRFLPVLLLFGVPTAIGGKDSPEWVVRIDAAARRGPSRVKNFLFVQGSPLLAGDEDGSNEASRQFEIAAWKALNLVSEGVPLIDGEPGQGLHVVRSREYGASPPLHLIGPLGPKRDLYLDTREFVMMQKYWRETFGGTGFRRVFGVGYMPKTLSSTPSPENFQTFPPADYPERGGVLATPPRSLT